MTGIELLAWLQPATLASHGERVRAAMDTRVEWVRGADDRVRATLRAVYDDPEAFVRDRRGRPAELTAILGRYDDGPREDVLLRAPGSAGVLEEVAERCRARLAALADVPDDLYAVAGELAAPEDAAHQVLLGEEREEQIRLKAALVKLIEDDRVGRAQERAITEHDAGVAKTMRVSLDITRSSRTT